MRCGDRLVARLVWLKYCTYRGRELVVFFLPSEGFISTGEFGGAILSLSFAGQGLSRPGRMAFFNFLWVGYFAKKRASFRVFLPKTRPVSGGTPKVCLATSIWRVGNSEVAIHVAAPAGGVEKGKVAPTLRTDATLM